MSVPPRSSAPLLIEEDTSAPSDEDIVLFPPPVSIPQTACSVGEGCLPLQMPGLAVLLPASRSIAPSLPARMGNQHFVREGVQGMVHDLHFHRVMGRQVPQSACEEAGNN